MTSSKILSLGLKPQENMTKIKDWIGFCVRQRRTHSNRVVFTEITLAGFVNQCCGY